VPLFRRALAIYEKALGPHHPDVAASLNGLAMALRHSDPAPDDPLLDPKADAKRRELLAMLTQEPGIHYSFATDDEREPDNLILAIAIRGKGMCEIRIPKSQYDRIAVLELIKRLTDIRKM
jgi:Tetratricopeptide repeat